MDRLHHVIPGLFLSVKALEWMGQTERFSTNAAFRRAQEEQYLLRPFRALQLIDSAAIPLK
jgi:hypothetical protein